MVAPCSTLLWAAWEAHPQRRQPLLLPHLSLALHQDARSQTPLFPRPKNGTIHHHCRLPCMTGTALVAAPLTKVTLRIGQGTAVITLINHIHLHQGPHIQLVRSHAVSSLTMIALYTGLLPHLTSICSVLILLLRHFHLAYRRHTRLPHCPTRQHYSVESPTVVPNPRLPPLYSQHLCHRCSTHLHPPKSHHPILTKTT